MPFWLSLPDHCTHSCIYPLVWLSGGSQRMSCIDGVANARIIKVKFKCLPICRSYGNAHPGLIGFWGLIYVLQIANTSVLIFSSSYILSVSMSVCLSVCLSYLQLFQTEILTILSLVFFSSYYFKFVGSLLKKNSCMLVYKLCINIYFES